MEEEREADPEEPSSPDQSVLLARQHTMLHLSKPSYAPLLSTNWVRTGAKLLWPRGIHHTDPGLRKVIPLFPATEDRLVTQTPPLLLTCFLPGHCYSKCGPGMGTVRLTRSLSEICILRPHFTPIEPVTLVVAPKNQCFPGLCGWFF